MNSLRGFCSALILLGCMACSDDTEADKIGVGAQCSSDDDCKLDEQSCLLEFKGGYCGLQGCTAHEQCPEGSACVEHSEGISGTVNYCFRICIDKAECNANRDLENESNCSANIKFINDQAPSQGSKVCVPPSG